MLNREYTDEMGFVTISPECPVTAGEWATWKFVYTVDGEGIEEGSLLLFGVPFGFSEPQFHNRTGEGYSRIFTSNMDISVVAHRVTEGIFEHFLNVKIHDGSLKKGDTVTCIYGDKCLGGPGSRAQEFTATVPFPNVGIIKGKNIKVKYIKNAPKVKIDCAEYMKLKPIIPSVANKGEMIKVCSLLEDKYRNIDIHTEDQNVINYYGNDAVKSVNIKANVKNIFRVKTLDYMHGLEGISNPCKVKTSESDYNIYWGDIHGHTELSDGMGTVDQYYNYAKNYSNLDFSAVTDHDDFSVMGFYLSDEDWKVVQEAAVKWYEPGKFVTFSAYEFTTNQPGRLDFKKHSHRNVYYFDDDQPVFRGSDEVPSVVELWGKLNGRKVMTVAHHNAWTPGGSDWENFNPEIERVVEIYSSWGNSEKPDPSCTMALPKDQQWTGYENSIQVALSKGYRLGFIGSSDTHSGRPGNTRWVRTSARKRGGYTAVLGNSLTRENIWDALYDRRCYATTGERILVDVKMNNEYDMGSEVKQNVGDKISLKISVAGTDIIEEIDVVKDNVDVQKTYPNSSDSETEYSEVFDGKTHYYYIRIRQKDKSMAWTSPIWVDHLGNGRQ